MIYFQFRLYVLSPWIALIESYDFIEYQGYFFRQPLRHSHRYRFLAERYTLDVLLDVAGTPSVFIRVRKTSR